jgi:trimeric autotransporter adhesin
VSAHLDPSKATVRLAELQSVVVTGNALGSVRPLSRDAVATLTADLKPKQMQAKDTPDEFQTPLMAREQGRAIQLATALLPPVTGGSPVSVKRTVTGVTGAATNLTDATAETLDQLMDTLRLGDTLVGGLVEGVGDPLQGTVGALGNTLTNTVGAVGNTLTSTVGGLGGSVGSLGGGGSLGGSVSSLGGTGGGSLGGTVGSLGGTVGSLGGTVGSLGGTVGGTVGGVGGTVGSVGGAVGGTVGGVLGGLGGLLGGGR